MDATKHLDDPTLSRDSLPLASVPPPSLPAKDTPPPSRGAKEPFPSHSPNFTHEAKPSTVSNDPERDAGGSPTPSLPWTDRHPCYPHPNQHVPLSSPLYATTRIIRIPRDWMLVGDLAPTFSNTYPEILSPWVSEQDFRTLVEKVNEGLIQAMNPWGIRNWLDALLGLATGWIWEDFGMTFARKRIRQVEQLLGDWNSQRQKAGTDGENELVRVVELRRTAYMTIFLDVPHYPVSANMCPLQLDFQIPDPKIGGSPSSPEQPTSRPETAPSAPVAEDETATERPDGPS
ncbi:hypothetical protein MMC11_003226 [Xylographa trunciseda]|nr:hypothetical protein [Xylographa trunciseda]